MTTLFNMARDINGYNSFITDPPDAVFGIILASNVHKEITIPSDASFYVAIFSYGQGTNTWVAYNQTAQIPNVTFQNLGSELLPTGYKVKAGNSLSFVTEETNATMSVKFYAIQQ